MRLILAFLGLALLTAAAPKQDWTTTVAQTPAGAYVLGNPAARVKLVEYASYTCPHCAAFATESDAVLKGRMIRSGSTSLELRHFIRDRLDLAAAVLARCGGARGFFGTHQAIFAAQKTWLPRGSEFDQNNAQRLSAYPLAAQLRALADGAGLSDIAKARGLTDPAIQACFADRAAIDRIVAMTSAAPDTIQGTPAFIVNGKQADSFAWAGLEPLLRAAGAR